MKCKNCSAIISTIQVYKWVRSFNRNLECSVCNRKVGDYTNLFFIYLVSAGFAIFVVLNNEGLVEDLPILGINSEFVLTLLILVVVLPLWTFLTAYLSVYVYNQIAK